MKKRLLSLLTATLTAFPAFPLLSVASSTAEGITNELYDPALDLPSVTFYVGEVRQIGALFDADYYQPDWVIQSENNDIAMVYRDGHLFAQKAGKTTVYLRANLDPEKVTLAPEDDGVRRVTAEITIEDAPAPLTEEQQAAIAQLEEKESDGDRLPRKKAVVKGLLDADAPRLTKTQVDSLIADSDSFEELFRKITDAQPFPDWYGGSGFTSVCYFFDDKGTERIRVNLPCSGNPPHDILYERLNQNGILEEAHYLYPESRVNEVIAVDPDPTLRDWLYCLYHDIPRNIKPYTITPTQLTMKEGESCKLTVTIDPEYANRASVSLYSSEHKTLVSSDGTVTAYHCGEDSILVYVSVPDDSSDIGKRTYSQEVQVQVQPDETLPSETRAELDRLEAISPYGDFQRRTLELLGVLDPQTPRITAEQVEEILQTHPDPTELDTLFNEIHGCPDFIWCGDPGDCVYWLDEKGSDTICISGDAMLTRTKVYDDGTVKEVSSLYPPEIDFGTIIGPMDSSDDIFIQFNQLPYDMSNPVSGDANHDGTFNLADLVALEKWLLAVPGTNLSRWTLADFNQDGKLNAIDLTLMKRELLNNHT